MTVFNLESNEGEGFKFVNSRVDSTTGEPVFDDPLPDAGTFFIRPIGAKLEAIQSRRKRVFENVVNPKTRAMERIAYFPERTAEEIKAENRELWDYCITGWDDKVLDSKGNPVPVTVEAKEKLMEIPAFDRFVARCFRLLAESAVKTEKSLEKN